MHHEVVVPGSHALVGKSVDEEVDAGVQVRYHRRVQVNRERVRVQLVRQQNNDVRSPTDAESDEDYDDHLNLSNRLYDRRLRAPRSETAAAAAGVEKSQLGLANVRENAPIAEHYDDEWKKHSGCDVEQGVVVRQCPVPQTLLRFPVERVSRPAGVAWHVERHADHPRHSDNDEIGSTGEQSPIGVVMTDVDVTVDADATDTE